MSEHEAARGEREGREETAQERRERIAKEGPKRRKEDFDINSDPEKLEHLTDIDDL